MILTTVLTAERKWTVRKMTIENAIEMVKTAFETWECEYGGLTDDWKEEHEACDMAVQALREKENE